MRALLVLIALGLGSLLAGCHSLRAQMDRAEPWDGVRSAVADFSRARADRSLWAVPAALDLAASALGDTLLWPGQAARWWSLRGQPDLPLEAENAVVVRTRKTHGVAQHSWIEFQEEGVWYELEVYGYGNGMRRGRDQNGGWRVLRSSGVSFYESAPSSVDEGWPVLAVLTGPPAVRTIARLRELVTEYASLDPPDEDLENGARSPRGYRTWPGPNSNTFIDWVGRRTPELRYELSHLAVGKDYARWFRLGPTTTGTGLELELPFFGVQAGLREGLELHLLGTTLGLTVWPPAVKLPFFHRWGFQHAWVDDPEGVVRRVGGT